MTDSESPFDKSAEDLWKYLDQLAEKSPDEYKKFLKEQQDAAAREQLVSDAKPGDFFTPVAMLSVSSKLTRGHTGMVYVNMCHSDQMPPMQDRNGRTASRGERTGNLLIPLSVGPMREWKGQNEASKLIDVVFPPDAAARMDNDMEFKLHLIELALQHSEEDHKISISRAYRIEPAKYSGGSGPAEQLTEAGVARVQQRRTERQQQHAQFSKEVNGKRDIVLPQSVGKGAGLPSVSSDIMTESDDTTELKLPGSATSASTTNSKTKPSSSSSSAKSAAPSKTAARPLIEEVDVNNTNTANSKGLKGGFLSTSAPPSSSSSSSSSTSAKKSATKDIKLPTARAAADEPLIALVSTRPTAATNTATATSSSTTPIAAAGPARPVYTMSCNNGVVTIVLQLPTINKASDVDVDISSTRVALSGANYLLDVSFPQPIDDSEAVASFSKKAKTLTITAPVSTIVT